VNWRARRAMTYGRDSGTRGISARSSVAISIAEVMLVLQVNLPSSKESATLLLSEVLPQPHTRHV
jgi:hypothetical protein